MCVPMGESNGRPVIVGMQMSLDGFVATEDGGLDWMWPYYDDELRTTLMAAVSQAKTHVMGRNTYLAQAAHWPTADDEIAAHVNTAEKVVFSRTLGRVDWQHARLANADLATEIAALKQNGAGRIVITGGAQLAQSATRLGLVDEYHLVVHPVALGAGLPLFGGLDRPLGLEVAASERYRAGAVRLVLRPRQS